MMDSAQDKQAQAKREEAKEKREIAFKAWKESLDMQKHFNDIVMRIRNFYFAYFALAGAAVGVVHGKEAGFGRIPLGVFVAGATPAVALYIMDRFYYYVMLVGAVQNAVNIETTSALKGQLWMSNDITKAAHTGRPFGVDLSSRWKVALFYSLPVMGASFVLVGWSGLCGATLFFGLCEVLGYLRRDAKPGVTADDVLKDS